MEVESGASEAGDLSRRVCDQCRTRKVRCDRQTPCSNCTTAKQRCSFTGAGQKPKEHRQRVLITTQYERKIDHIQRRLSSIEVALSEITESQRRIESSTQARRPGTHHGSASQSSSPSASCAGPSTDGHAPTKAVNTDASVASDTTLNGPGFEGDSSVAAHAALASECFEHAVEQHSIQQSGPRLRIALSSLQHLLEMQKQASQTDFSNAKPLQSGGFRDLPMPPLEYIVKVLRELKETIPRSFTLLCSLTSVEYFTELCRKVYFATDDFTQATFIITNAGLYYILQEKTALAMQAGDEDMTNTLQKYCDMCRDNLETVLSDLNMLMPARKENVEALVMAASYTIEISKPSLAWRLNTTACQLCLSLGYHRAAIRPGDDQQAKRSTTVLFWVAYIFDKTLALRLGRPSTLQDYDITLSRTLETFPEFDDHRRNIQSWLAHAEVKGRMYEDLFSPRALTQPLELRTQRAHACAAVLLEEGDKIYRVRKRFEQGPIDMQGGDAHISAMLLRSDEVSLLSSLTLIYRTIPPEAPKSPSEGAPTSFSRDCIHTARKTIQMHLECTKLIGTNHMLAPAYMHWRVSFSPFIPFIVLFCYVLETSDMADLQRIESFMASLEPWRHLSDQIDRLFRLCQTLYNIAVVFIESKRMQNEQCMPHDEGGASEDALPGRLDAYMNQLGFIPGDDLNATFDGDDGQDAVMALDPKAHHSTDWYSSYMNIVGLLEFSPSAEYSTWRT